MNPRCTVKEQALIALFVIFSAALFVSLYVAYGRAAPLEEETNSVRGPRILEMEDVRFDSDSNGGVRFEVEAGSCAIRSVKLGGYVLRPYKRLHLREVRVRRIEQGGLRETLSSESGTYDFLLDELRLFGRVDLQLPGSGPLPCKGARVRIRENRIGIER